MKQYFIVVIRFTVEYGRIYYTYIEYQRDTTQKLFYNEHNFVNIHTFTFINVKALPIFFNNTLFDMNQFKRKLIYKKYKYNKL